MTPKVYLWCLQDSPRLSAEARSLMQGASRIFVSAASIWEAAIKAGLGKLQVDPNDVVGGIAASGFLELPVLGRHAARVSSLPFHHKDPFDRLLVAQAMEEPLRLLTTDRLLQAYSPLVQVI